VPQTVADNGAFREAIAVIAGIENAAQSRLGVEQREKVKADGVGLDAERLLLACDVSRATNDR
jgi:hypothetical protein